MIFDSLTKDAMAQEAAGIEPEPTIEERVTTVEEAVTLIAEVVL